MTTPTDLDLRLFLAKQLPEEISGLPTKNHGTMFFWRDGAFVTSREWDYIVRRVEEKMDISQREDYLIELGWSYKSCLYEDSKVVCASWQTRATALRQIAQREKEAV